jgi:type II secretory pathway predicted ATPase ExeA
MEKVGLGGIKPFWDRVYNKTYILRPFNIQETEKLITSRLQKRRIKESKINHLFPFKKDFVKAINEISKGVPRRILMRTALVLDIADQKGLERIGGEDARKILAEHKYV